jgi:hypothetical protein
MSLILTIHSGSIRHVYGYPGLASSTVLRWPPTHNLGEKSHATVVLHPGGNARALLTWRANTATGPAPFNPNIVHVTPPDEHAYLLAVWPERPWSGAATSPPGRRPRRPALPGLSTGAPSRALQRHVLTLAADGTTSGAEMQPGASSQQWIGYSDGTLRINGSVPARHRPEAEAAQAKVAACTGAASQKWEIGQVSANDFGPITNAGTGTVLSYPRGSIADGTPLVMGLGNGDQSTPWHVSFHHYMTG